MSQRGQGEKRNENDPAAASTPPLYSVENWSIWNAFSADENPPVEVAMNDAGGFYVDNR